VDRLRNGRSLSCGCLKSDAMKKRFTLHGHARRYQPTPTYTAFQGMHERCGNTNRHGYKRYGGRGITVCDRWNSFENFLEDMGERPTGTSLDRRDNDAGYNPGNCRWATRNQQARNTRSNRLVTFNGQTECVAAWSELTKLPETTISSRLNAGWPISDALTTPARKYRRKAS
jgi:hypothetical protein